MALSNSMAADDSTLLGPRAPHDETGVAPGGTSNTSAPQRVDRYRIGARIGEGAMGSVYRAQDSSLGRALAIKFLHPELCADEEYRHRFVQEARAAGMLSHPNIVTVFDTGELDRRPYIVMELLDGTPLSESMSAGTGLPVHEAVEIGLQLASALDYAHSRGIVHRDIKPSNIMRLREGNTIKVTDFGIAHIDRPGDAQRTRVGTVIGTPQYMSPEQARGEKVDARSDLFSVGVVLYQLLTGRQPFEADSVVTLMLRIANEEPQPIERTRRDIPAALRRVVHRCLRKDPGKRFRSGRELAEALQRVRRDLSEDATKAGRPRLLPLRVKWTLMMACVVAVTMAITATLVVQRQQRALMEQVVDYGSSLSRFMAGQNAIPVLSDDWVAVEVFVQETLRGQDFHDLVIVDHQGVVRASSHPAQIGGPYAEPAGEQIRARGAAVGVKRYRDATGLSVLGFDAPITFRDKEIGRLHLGIAEQPLKRVAHLSLLLMASLIAITVAAVMIATYFIADRYSRPIRVITEAMGEIGKGNHDFRVGERRQDEFGELYAAFDDMAQTLQNHPEPAATTPAPRSSVREQM